MTPKSLKDINRLFIDEIEKTSDTTRQSGHKMSFLRIFSDILFYFAVIAVLYSVMSLNTTDGKPRNIVGYSYFSVMSSSMSGEIDKGSLIVVRKLNPQFYKIGDNITYLREGGTTITHKIINIYDSHTHDGKPGFQTKGIGNANPDPDIVPADDVIGKVVLIVPNAGYLMISISENIHLILIIFLLCSLLSFLLRGITEKRKDE